MKALLAIDQGTSSSRAVLYDTAGRQLAFSQQDITQYYPKDGWVEHDPEEIWQATLATVKQVLASPAGQEHTVVACGITNQRETTVLWDKVSGKVLHRAIVWQDRRTHEQCKQLQQYHEMVQHKTGLLLDPYFSATKLKWLLQNVPNTTKLAEEGRLAFGTIDSYLLWKFTKGAIHATDATNASRTMLFNIKDQCWDQELLDVFGIPMNILPEVLDCNANFGMIAPEFCDTQIPITGIVGDQQAATIGQACFEEGMIKATYGTGGFLLLNTGMELVRSQHRLLTTIAYRINGEVTYGLEGSIFNAGTTVKWLRDELNIINHASETESLAASLDNNGGVYLVPAFTGLGAPFWDPNARGAILGLQRDTTIAHLARAALEAVCYQTEDVLNCMRHDTGKMITKLRVDGGMAVNNWLLQFLSNLSSIEIQRPNDKETTAFGAAIVAGLGVNCYQSLHQAAAIWQCNKRFTPDAGNVAQKDVYQQWQKAVDRVR